MDASRSPFGVSTAAARHFCNVQVTVCESAGAAARKLEQRPPSDHTVLAAPGDNTEANNYIPFDDSNAFVAPVRVTLGASTKQNVSVLPEHVALTAIVSREAGVIWDLRVTVTNNLGATAAAILAVPRLPDLLLLEEEHVCGGVEFRPTIMEKEQADAHFEMAAASSTHSATLSDTAEDAFHIKLDKIPDGATATFGCRFLQSAGLKRRDAVGADGDTPATCIGDLTIVPGYTPLDGAGVPFDFTLHVGPGLRVTLPEDEVLREDVTKCTADASAASLRRFAHRAHSTDPNLPPDLPPPAICEIVQLGPTLLSGNGSERGMRRLSWKSVCGLSRGTLLRCRLAEAQPDLTKALSTLSLGGSGSGSGAAPPTDTAANLHAALHMVDTIDAVAFEPTDGSKLASTLVELTVPLSPLPGLEAATAPHEIYVIIDTSGSTGMRVHSAALGGQVSPLP